MTNGRILRDVVKIAGIISVHGGEHAVDDVLRFRDVRIIILAS